MSNEQEQGDFQDIIIDKGSGINISEIDNLLAAKPVATHIETPKFIPKFQPKIQTKTQPEPQPKIKTEPTISPETIDNNLTDEQLKEAQLNLEQLSKARVKTVNEAKATGSSIDFSGMTEQDVFNLKIPISMVQHDLPDYLNVTLKDNNYVPRWVHKHPRRLGQMLAIGYSYVVPEDLADSLNLSVPLDENGVYKFDDVILCKVSKEIHYGMLRRNHLRSLAMVNPKTTHQYMQQSVTNQMRDSAPASFDKYASAGKLAVYIPGEK